MSVPMIDPYNGRAIAEVGPAYKDLDKAAAQAILNDIRRIRNIGYRIGVAQGVFPPPETKLPPHVNQAIVEQIDLLYIGQRAHDMKVN